MARTGSRCCGHSRRLVKRSVGRSSYSGKEQLEAYKLPTYVGGSQTAKQVLLTPFAVAVDATILGAVIGYYSAPGILADLSR
jgi:hypothetical protein